MNKGIAVLVLIFVLLTAGWIASSVASATQAQATLETARAAQIAAAGQTTQSVLNTFLVMALCLVTVTGTIVIGMLLRHQRRVETMLREQMSGIPTRRSNSARWAPGPNAGWRRLSSTERPVLLNAEPSESILVVPANDEEEDEIMLDLWGF